MNTNYKFDVNEKALDELKELMSDLFDVVSEIESHDKKGKKYSIAPCMVGKKYREQDTRVMIIGQQANGWKKADFSCGDLYGEDYMKNFFATDGFDWIVQDPDGRQHNIPEEGEKVYWLTRSNFWKWTRAVTERILNFDQDTDDRKNIGIWQDYIVQSDTIKIGYFKPDKKEEKSKTTNVSRWAINMQKDICYEIIKKEIEILQPTHIIFVTDDDDSTWFFNGLKAMLSDRTDDNVFIKMAGKINGSKTIVTVHPQRGSYINREKLINKYKTDANRLEIYVKECINAFDNIE